MRRYLFKKRWKRVLIGLVDFFGAFVWALPNLIGKITPRSSRPKHILVVRLDSLGDGILTLPAIQSLRKRYPQAQIDFLASRPIFNLYAFFFFPHANIHLFEPNWLTGKNSLVSFLKLAKKLSQFKYDLGIDFRGDLRTILLMGLAGIRERWGRGGTGGGFLLGRSLSVHPERHEVLEYLDLVGEGEAPPRIEFPELSLAEQETQRIQKWLRPVGTGRKIVIHPGAGYPSKRWPASNFIELARKIHEKKLGTPIFVGGETEKDILGSFQFGPRQGILDLTGRTSLAELLCLLRESDLFIGNDSGPAHLAAFLNRKLVVIFSGTNDSKKWSPWSSSLRLVKRPVPCSPCEEKICPLERHLCMDDISIEEVLGAVEESLRE